MSNQRDQESGSGSRGKKTVPITAPTSSDHADAGEAEIASRHDMPTAPATSSGGIDSEDLKISTPPLTRLGHYSLIRIIAEGGMGTVYEAIQDKPRRVVAVKRMHHGLKSQAAQRRFEAESQMLARLRHPAIGQVYEAGTDQFGHLTLPFFAMEFVPGAKAITDYVVEHDLPVRQRLELFIQVCDALEHAHEKGILHRDLKPQNILVDLNGRPKVIDFGIARAIDADQVPASLQTSPDQLLGTLQYMSPEQLDGDPRELDARADVYALGVVLYELLCGQLPFDLTRSRLTEASRVLHEKQPPRPSTIKRELSGDLETVVLAAMHRDRERRYQSARELANDVRHVIHGEPINQRRDSATYVMRTKLRTGIARNRVASVVISAMLALVIAQTVGAFGDRWLLINNRYDRLAVKHLTKFPGPQFDHVRLIVLTEKTDMARAARAMGLDSTGRKEEMSRRSIIGAALGRLARAGPRAVALDHSFPAPSPDPADDQRLAAGIDALRSVGITPIISVDTWLTDLNGSKHISPAIADRVRWGVPTISFTPDEPWSVHLAAEHADGQTIPSLAIQAWIAATAPKESATFKINNYLRQLEVEFGSTGDRARQIRRVPLIEAKPPTAGRTTGGIDSAKLVAQYLLAVPPDSVLESSSVDIVDVLEADDARLQQWFAGKLVLFGGRDPQKDRYDYPLDGRSLSGCDLQATAIDSLLAGRHVTHYPLLHVLPKFDVDLSLPTEAMLVILGTCLGVVVAQRLRSTGRWALEAGLLLFVVAACIFVYREFHWLYSPWVPLLCAVISFELARSTRGVATRALV